MEWSYDEDDLNIPNLGRDGRTVSPVGVMVQGSPAFPDWQPGMGWMVVEERDGSVQGAHVCTAPLCEWSFTREHKHPTFV